MATEMAGLHDRIGICQWFHMGDVGQVESTIRALDDLGVRHLRTGISWADYHRPGGRKWYAWQMRELHSAGLELLVSVWHTPPSISMDPALGCASVPPADPRAFADFLDVVIDQYGAWFEHIELWNEPNNPYKWDVRYDPDHQHFAESICNAGNWARERGKVPVMGGVTLLDYDFVDRLNELKALDFVDVFGIHAFPGMWEPYATDWEHPSHWYGWPHRVSEMSDAARGLPVWVTETGLATYWKDEDRRCREAEQVEALKAALEAPADRLYWYCLFDLNPARLAIEETCGGPREGAEYHMGLIRWSPGYEIRGREKPAYRALRRAMRLSQPAPARGRRGGSDPGEVASAIEL